MTVSIKYIRFVAPWSYKPNPNMTIDYEPGHEILLSDEAAQAALEAGVAVEAKGKRTKNGDDDGGLDKG